MTQGKKCTWTVVQENDALEFMALGGLMSAYDVAIEIELPVADTERMLQAMIRAEVIDMIPMYQIKPLVRAA